MHKLWLNMAAAIRFTHTHTRTNTRVVLLLTSVCGCVGGQHLDSVGTVDTEVLFDSLDNSLLVPPKQNELKMQDTTNTKQSQTQQQKKQQKKVKASSKKQPYAREPKQQQQEQQLKCEGQAEGGGIKPKACTGGEYCTSYGSTWLRRSDSNTHTHTHTHTIAHTHVSWSSPHIGLLLCRWSAFEQCRHRGSVRFAGCFASGAANAQ